MGFSFYKHRIIHSSLYCCIYFIWKHVFRPFFPQKTANSHVPFRFVFNWSRCRSGFSSHKSKQWLFCLFFLTCITFQEAIQLDGEILFALLRRISPIAYRHLEKHKIDPVLYMTEWFMCAFSRTLPWASVLRVWDMFLCDGNTFLYLLQMWGQNHICISPPLPLLGVKIIFRVGLVLLTCMLGTREKLKACQGQYETMELLRAIEPQYMQEGFLVREVKLHISPTSQMSCLYPSSKTKMPLAKAEPFS